MLAVLVLSTGWSQFYLQPPINQTGYVGVMFCLGFFVSPFAMHSLF